MLLELGLGARGRIACTQPRRLPAVAMARRVAAELGEEAGGTVGFRHRFARCTSDATKIEFMTDGILLSELRHDRLLRAYSAIIVDEAHERSLNIDILLGFLKRILAVRRDLRVVVSSATLDVGLFSEFFGGAPVVSVPGKRHPVEIRYMPPEDSSEADLAGEVLRAAADLPGDGDVLVFLPGERDIRDAREALSAPGAATGGCEIVPLMASLPAAEQQRAFRPSARRKIILSTNVAETSLTVPGVKYVVDSGLARVSRFIHRSGVQRLQIEPVSQASANQRAGRCGRTSPGICIRLYSEDDFQRRPEFTTPEILRSSLAGAILSMLDLNIRDVAAFPFITPPEPSMVRVAMRELEELGAVSRDRRGDAALTETGRRLSQMPVEPRIGRMILAAGDEKAAAQAIPVAAFLSCEDPRRHSIEDRDRAREAYAKFKAPASDFASILKMWLWWREEAKELSQNKRRKLCKQNYLSYNRMAEWQDVARQLENVARRNGIDTACDKGGDRGFHRALLAGLISRTGKWHEPSRCYRGAGGMAFSVSQASALRKSQPPWIMAAEIVDTRRPLANIAAPVDPEWLEEIGAPLCRHTWRDPWWDAESGFVRAFEDVTLFGMALATGRRCDFSRVDPAMSRDIFIRRGLIDGEIPSPPRVVAANSEVMSKMRSAAGKARRPELFDEDALAAFFDTAMPAGICSARALAKWLFAAKPAEAARFRLNPAQWLPEGDVDDADFPDAVSIDGVRFPLEYRDTSGAEDDGITCVARKSKAALLRRWRSEWLVPGLLPDKLRWMLSCLPSAQRRALGRTDEVVSWLSSHLKPGELPLAEALSKALSRERGIHVKPDAWDGMQVPACYAVRFAVVDDRTRKPLAAGRDLAAVLEAAGIGDSAAAGHREPVRVFHKTWDFGDLPEEAGQASLGWKVSRHTALRDCGGDGVEIVAVDTAEEADEVSAAGLARLLTLSLGSRAGASLRLPKMSFQTQLWLKGRSCDEKALGRDILAGAVMECAVRGRPRVLTAAGFEERRELLAKGLSAALAQSSPLVCEGVARASALDTVLRTDARLAPGTVDAILAQIDWLFFSGFAARLPLDRLRQYPRYLDAITIRIERARLSPSSDALRQEQVDRHWKRYRDLVAGDGLRFADRRALVEYRWMVEELRVSLFAQELKTPQPVSEKRLDAKWREVTGQGTAPRR